MPIEELHREVEEWVVDLGNMTGREVAYDRMIMLYWVNKNLILHASLSNTTKRKGDEEPVRAWKDHNADYIILMHKSMGIMAS